jgi:hypothetical protein
VIGAFPTTDLVKSMKITETGKAYVQLREGITS